MVVGVEGAESRCPQIPLRWLPCGVSHTLQQREALAAGRWMGIDGAHWLPFCSRCWLWVGGAAATQQPGAKGKADGWLDGWLAGEIRQTACDAPVSDRGREPTGAVEKGRGDGVWMQRREKKGVAGSQGRKRLGGGAQASVESGDGFFFFSFVFSSTVFDCNFCMPVVESGLMEGQRAMRNLSCVVWRP